MDSGGPIDMGTVRVFVGNKVCVRTLFLFGLFGLVQLFLVAGIKINGS